MVVVFRTRRQQPRRGAAAVEFGFLLPFLMILVLGIWEVGRLLEVNQMLYNAAREGCRQASTGLVNSATVQQIVTNYLKNAGLSTNNVSVTVQDLTSPGTDPTAATWMDQLQVTVTIPCKDVTWTNLRLVTSPTTQMTVQATWNSMKDQVYPTNVTPPPGY